MLRDGIMKAIGLILNTSIAILGFAGGVTSECFRVATKVLMTSNKNHVSALSPVAAVPLVGQSAGVVYIVTRMFASEAISDLADVNFLLRLPIQAASAFLSGCYAVSSPSQPNCGKAMTR